MNDALVVEVVRKAVTVDCSVEEAFRIFTADAISWWPVENHSIHQSVEKIVFEPQEGGEVYEVSEAGDRGHWATITEWDPPTGFVLAWEVTPAVLGTEVEVRFLRGDAHTRVELEHRGWERVVEHDPDKRGDYEAGWEVVLGTYAERI